MKAIYLSSMEKSLIHCSISFFPSPDLQGALNLADPDPPFFFLQRTTGEATTIEDFLFLSLLLFFFILQVWKMAIFFPVSYTHLTLPTILLV